MNWGNVMALIRKSSTPVILPSDFRVYICELPERHTFVYTTSQLIIQLYTVLNPIVPQSEEMQLLCITSLFESGPTFVDYISICHPTRTMLHLVITQWSASVLAGPLLRKSIADLPAEGCNRGSQKIQGLPFVRAEGHNWNQSSSFHKNQMFRDWTLALGITTCAQSIEPLCHLHFLSKIQSLRSTTKTILRRSWTRMCTTQDFCVSGLWKIKFVEPVGSIGQVVQGYFNVIHSESME